MIPEEPLLQFASILLLFAGVSGIGTLIWAKTASRHRS